MSGEGYRFHCEGHVSFKGMKALYWTNTVGSFQHFPIRQRDSACVEEMNG